MAYLKNVPRVSSLVELAFPFTGTEEERRYFTWLDEHKINREEYLRGAAEWGTAIHERLEQYILRKMMAPYPIWVEKEIEH